MIRFYNLFLNILNKFMIEWLTEFMYFFSIQTWTYK